MDDQAYDLVLRDPEGGILMRWICDEQGRPCLGNGALVPGWVVEETMQFEVGEDRRARKEAAR